MNINILPPLLYHYEFVQKIGAGSFSTVWSIRDKSGNLYACKMPDCEDDFRFVMTEAQTMSQLSKHPNTSPFLTFYGVYEYDNKPVIVSELFVGSELYKLTKAVEENKITLTENQICNFAKLIFQQLSYLHNKGLSHKDIHAGNILYNENRLVLIDVGGQVYDNMEDLKSNSEYFYIPQENLDKALNLGFDLNTLFQKRDIFDAGEVIYKLVKEFDIPYYEEFILNNDKYQLHSQYPIIDKIVNSAMNLDITQRPSADDILTYINTFEV